MLRIALDEIPVNADRKGEIRVGEKDFSVRRV
jgi:hypothetical protein